MSNGFVIRHVVSIAGCVRERPSTGIPLSHRENERRLAGAIIEIIAGPPAFETLRAAWALDPVQRNARPDRTSSQADGIYFFTDLPPGAYRLRVSAPEHGSRFGIFEADGIDVPPAAEFGHAVTVMHVNVDLPFNACARGCHTVGYGSFCARWPGTRTR